MTTACSRGVCRKRITYIKALCVDHDSSDFGRSIKIEIPDGYVILLPEGEDIDKLRHEMQHLSKALDELRQVVRCANDTP